MLQYNKIAFQSPSNPISPLPPFDASLHYRSADYHRSLPCHLFTFASLRSGSLARSAVGFVTCSRSMPIARVFGRTLRCKDSGFHMATACFVALRHPFGFSGSGEKGFEWARAGGTIVAWFPAIRLGSMLNAIVNIFHAVIGLFTLPGFANRAFRFIPCTTCSGPTLSAIRHSPLPTPSIYLSLPGLVVACYHHTASTSSLNCLAHQLLVISLRNSTDILALGSQVHLGPSNCPRAQPRDWPWILSLQPLSRLSTGSTISYSPAAELKLKG